MSETAAADRHLGRILRREVDVSALLAYCAVLDPNPLQRLLGLPEAITDARVEVQHGKADRLDVVLDGTAAPQAVLELKVSATEHGNQFARYDEYAAEYDAVRFVVDLELPGTRAPRGWQRLNLADVFGCWTDSSNMAARTFGDQIAQVFRSWTEQAHGTFANLDPAMLPVVFRSVASDLSASGVQASATATSGGLPALVVMEPHPSGVEGTFLCIVVRQDHADSARPWSLRAGVHVSAGCGSPPQVVANRLMAELESNLTLRAVRASLPRPELAATVTGDRPIKTSKSRDADVEHWLSAAAMPGRARLPRHPTYYQDLRGRRLSARFDLDVSPLTANDLRDVIAANTAHLLSSTSPADTDVSGNRRVNAAGSASSAVDATHHGDADHSATIWRPDAAQRPN